MSPPAEESFNRLFRGLSPDRRVAFVAGLWAARGWDVERREGDLLATKDSVERRIRIIDSGRLLTPDVNDADVVVPTRDRSALCNAVEASGADYVPPAALRERLLYGIDREAAAALFEETLGRPLETPESHVTSPLSNRLREAVESGRRRGRRLFNGGRFAAAVLLLALVVGAVVVGPTLAPPEEATQPITGSVARGEVGAIGGSTATATSAPTATPTSLPPGVNRAGIEDLAQLLVAHREGVSSRQRTLHVRASGPPNATLMSGRNAWNYTVRIEQNWLYRFDATYRFPDKRGDGPVRIAVYANGGVNYRRVVDGSGVTYQRYPTEAAGYASKYTGEVVRYLQTFLRGQWSTADCTGEWALTCRVTVTGAPPGLPEGVADYRATAVVETDGVVSSLEVNYTLPDRDGDGARERVRFAFDYRALGRTTVSEPAWLPTAKNETDG